MAVLIATADGNLSAAATWGVVDATSLLDSEAANTNLTAAYVESQAFTPGAITVDGLAVKVAARPGAAGTISVRLAQAGATVAGTEVTIDVTDIASRAAEQGWYFFKFAAPVTLLAATPYTLSAKTSAITLVALYRNATAGNWSRMLRTTTTGAPAAGDSMHVLGEWTAAATVTTRTVTMDSTAATDYGDGVVANPPGFTIGKSGTLTWGTTAATSYILRLSTRLTVYVGGTLNMGTSGTPCPRDGSQQLEFDCAAADGDFGLVVYGTWAAQGLSRTSGKNIVRCLLNTDEAAAQTVLGVDTDTGWLNADDIAIASTTQTSTQAETRTLNGNAGASSVTVSVGLTNAHSGTSPTQAEVILLTRNVRVQSVSSTFMAYVYIGAASQVDLDWTAFRYLGSATTGKRGVEVATDANGSFACSYCALRDFDNHGIFGASSTNDNIAIDNLTGYKVGHQGASHAAIYIPLTPGSNWSIVNVDVIANNTGQGAGVKLDSYGGTVTNIRCNSGGGHGLQLAAAATAPLSIHKTWSGVNCHSHGLAGLNAEGLDIGKISNVYLWRNTAAATAGLFLNTYVGELTLETGAIFGNGSANIGYGGTGGSRRLILRSFTVNGDTSFAVARGFLFNAIAVPANLELDNCVVGEVSGIFTAHSTGDIDLGNTPRFVDIVLRNSKLASATPVANLASMITRSRIAHQRFNQTADTHKTVFGHGTVAREGTIYKTAAPSQSLTPSSAGAGEKLQSGPKQKRIGSGATVSISVYVRKSTLYTGSAPRLMQRANPAIGVLTDTVIATHSAAADVWEQLSGTTAAASENGVAEFYVDCDGAAGVVYVDDWA